MENDRGKGNTREYAISTDDMWLDYLWRFCSYVGVPVVAIAALSACTSLEERQILIEPVDVPATATVDSWDVPEPLYLTPGPTGLLPTTTETLIIPTVTPVNTATPEPTATPDMSFIFGGIDFEKSPLPITLSFRSGDGVDSILDGLSVSFMSVRWHNDVSYEDFMKIFRPGNGNAGTLLDQDRNMILLGHSGYIKPLFSGWTPLEFETIRDAIEGGGKTLNEDGLWTHMLSESERDSNLASVIGTIVTGLQGYETTEFTILAAGYIEHENVAEFERDAARILEQTIKFTGGEESQFAALRGRDGIIYLVICGWDMVTSDHDTTYSRYVLALRILP